MGEQYEGPDSLLTEDYLDEKLMAFEQQVIRDFRRGMMRLAIGITLAAVAGAAVSAAINAAAST